MNCQDAIRLANGYVDAELDAAGALAIEEHLQACPRCRAHLENLRALRDAVRRGTQFLAPPASLRERLQARYGQAAMRRASLPRRPWLAGAGAAALLVLVLWLGAGGLRGPAPHGQPLAARVVVHVSDSASAGAILRNLANHLEASPATRVVVVAHNDGVNFLLQGARDASGQPFEAAVEKLKSRGVDFRVCANTLVRRKLDTAAVIPAARLVPSGVAEISRLQIEEGYAYLKL
ncbi:MAG TPA: DsrE family protein [Burkholderiales bacterium]|nr:DsrE family protein [Burkholderiales bacterium]